MQQWSVSVWQTVKKSRAVKHPLCIQDCWMTEVAVSSVVWLFPHMLLEVVVSSAGVGATTSCRCFMCSKVFSIARKRFSKHVVPKIPTCSCGLSGSIARIHHAQDGPSGSRSHSSSGSGISPKTLSISLLCTCDTVSHHFLHLVLT